jgi:PKD repeat protein
MRSSRVLTLAAVALLAACGDSNGPSNPAPTAAFNAPTCTLLACDFAGSGTDVGGGTIASYSWDFGDPASGASNTATTQNASHTFSAAETYTVKLTVTDNGGATGTVSHDVTVAAVPNTAPTASFAFACSDLACSFTDQSGDPDGSVASYAWDFGDPNSGAANTAATKNPSHTFSAAGAFNVKLTVTDNLGGTNSKTTTVNVTAPAAGGPTASFTVSCASLDCTITNTSTATGSVVSWAWDFGDGTQTSTLQNPDPVHYNATSPTDFTITLVVTSDGATSQATQQVRVVPAATLTCNGVDCTLPVPAGATVMVTLVSSDCEAHGNTFVITQPAPADTLFTDGCFATPGTTFPLNNGAAYTSDTELAAEVLSGLSGATNPQLQVTGDFASGWTVSFDDGFVGPGEPDFNDLVILVKATGP